jgi:hypothetical protein
VHLWVQSLQQEIGVSRSLRRACAAAMLRRCAPQRGNGVAKSREIMPQSTGPRRQVKAYVYCKHSSDVLVLLLHQYKLSNHFLLQHNLVSLGHGLVLLRLLNRFLATSAQRGD